MKSRNLGQWDLVIADFILLRLKQEYYLPSANNFQSYTQIGNQAFISYSGAYSYTGRSMLICGHCRTLTVPCGRYAQTNWTSSPKRACGLKRTVTPSTSPFSRDTGIRCVAPPPLPSIVLLPCSWDTQLARRSLLLPHSRRMDAVRMRMWRRLMATLAGSAVAHTLLRRTDSCGLLATHTVLIQQVEEGSLSPAR